MNSIDRLSELFKSFPGIGPRQARRFVYHLLSRNGSYSEELISAIKDLKSEIMQCVSCERHFHSRERRETLCRVCSDSGRDHTSLMVVSRDVDLEAVEKSGSYQGDYFVLGGVIPLLDKEPEKRVRLSKLKERVSKGLENGLQEIILAMNVTQDGEHTASFLREYLKDFNLNFSTLGRGLSTGAELEYADPETLKNALNNRVK